ncbi:ParA family protein [Agaribacterium haliotis]|uniref:ParA family protein n=1 Tax=Agaribacterium haliotis TaxID=2013869 RepID=UPI000BB549CD|nr:ParA family protein [Agaribacterium haliotis]
MDQVFVVNPKGGCGKTTIATHLAAYYANAGRAVLLADHDAQKSSSDWLASRPSSCAPILCEVLEAEQVPQVNQASLIIHDMPAAYGLKDFSYIAKAGDRILIPVLSSPTDIKACLRFIMALNREGLMDVGMQVGFIANKVRRHTAYFSVLDEFLQRVDLPLVGEIYDSQHYIRLMDKGLSLFDLKTAKLRAEQERWGQIFSWLSL